MRSAVILLLIVGIAACNSEVEEVSEFKHPDEIVNPNGDSELAIVMRNLHYEADIVRAAIEKGEEADFTKLKELSDRLTTSVPTDSNVLDEDYYMMSGLVQSKVNEILESSDPAIEFDGLVSTCITCHRSTCPGPIGKIEKLRINS